MKSCAKRGATLRHITCVCGYPGEQQQRRPATARHQVDRRAGGLDLPLFEAGEKSGIVASISLITPANACARSNVFMRQRLFRKGGDRRGLIGAKLQTWAIGSVEWAAEQSKST